MQSAEQSLTDPPENPCSELKHLLLSPMHDGDCDAAQIHYLEQPCSDYVRASVQTASDIHREDAPGDILIFLTGRVARYDCLILAVRAEW